MGLYEQDEDNDLVKRLRKEIDDRDKALKQRDQEIAKFRQKEGQRVIAETFTARGVNPALARFALVDLGDDLTEENVARWLDENGSLFGAQAAPPAQQEQELQQQADPYRRMAAVEQVAQPGVPASDLARLEAMSGEELDAMIRQNGGF